VRRRAGWVVAVIGLALALSAVTGVAVGRSPDSPTGSSAGSRPAGSPVAAAGGDALAREITRLQDALRRQPQDYAGWAALGLDYVAQAKISVDPSYYPKADGALARSLSINSTENFAAMAGMAALKAGEHDFAAARTWAQRGLALNPHNATLYGALNDAETQLGHYDEAAHAAQQMNNLQPGVPAFARASYVFELHGDLPNARATMARALADAATPADRAFAHYYVGELAFSSGDPSTALAENEAGLAADPTSAACRQGRARAEAALGNSDAAVRDYLQVVSEVPQPQYLIEVGELLQSLGREREAQQQYAVFGSEVALFQANGVTLDTDPTLFYADHGDPQLALQFGAAGLAIRPFLEMEDAFAWALHVNGRDPEALAHEHAAMALGTRNALFYFHAGMIEKSLRQSAAAVTDLTTALAINPHFSPYQVPVAHRALIELGAPE
jgi:tetratricopeptide (TPR) repeat protein